METIEMLANHIRTSYLFLFLIIKEPLITHTKVAKESQNESSQGSFFQQRKQSPNKILVL